MSLIAVIVAFLGIGAAVRQWWVLALPVVCGAVAAAAIALSGHGLSDTPIPFLMIVGAASAAAGVAFGRSRRERRAAI